jgi:hypothetical protein
MRQIPPIIIRDLAGTKPAKAFEAYNKHILIIQRIAKCELEKRGMLYNLPSN